jgi:hypothetical protein
VEVSYTVTNTNDHSIEIVPPRSPCDCSVADLEKSTLLPGESTIVKVVFDPTNYDGKVVKSVYLKSKNSEEEIRLVLTGTIHL